MRGQFSESEPGESRLVEALGRGDRRAFRELVRRDGRWVRGLIYAVLGSAEDVDDVSQEVWLQVWQRAPTLEDPGRWRSWLCRIARNAAIDSLRRGRHRGRVLDGLRREAAPGGTDGVPADALLERDEEYDRILRAIEGLPEIYRQCFVLRHVESWGYRDISEALAIPVATVETRLSRARRLLRAALGRPSAARGDAD